MSIISCDPADDYGSPKRLSEIQGFRELLPIYWNHIIFAKDLADPPAADHQDTKAQSLIVINIFSLCLRALVAILSSLSGLGI